MSRSWRPHISPMRRPPTGRLSRMHRAGSIRGQWHESIYLVLGERRLVAPGARLSQGDGRHGQGRGTHLLNRSRGEVQAGKATSDREPAEGGLLCWERTSMIRRSAFGMGPCRSSGGVEDGWKHRRLAVNVCSLQRTGVLGKSIVSKTRYRESDYLHKYSI